LLTRTNDGANFGQFDENHVRELRLGVVGDADRRGVLREIDPFVGFAVVKLLGYLAHGEVV
jgi:hypothetical protein